jgi:hypothetical protein
MFKKHHKGKWKKYTKESTKEAGQRTHKTVMGVPDLATHIFDTMGGKPENLKGAFGRKIDSSGRRVRYGGLGESRQS